MLIKEKIKILKKMKLIRIVEESIAEKYSENKMRCPTHLCSGQEAVAAAIGQLLRKNDYVVGTYAEFALRGNWIEPETTINNTSSFRKLVGEEPVVTEEQKKAALEWAELKAEEVLQGKFGRGLCGECHEIVDNEKTNSWDVAPVHIPTKWLPKSHFSHKPHKDRKCAT